MVCRLVDPKFSQTVSFMYFMEGWYISGIAIVWNQHYETNRVKYELQFLYVDRYGMAFGMVPTTALNERSLIYWTDE